MLAVEELMKDAKPDLVLSGVNRGHNTAEDVTMSGTVAGAIQGMALGVPAIALSQALAVFHDDEVAHYDTAEAFAPGIIAAPAGGRLAEGRGHQHQLPEPAAGRGRQRSR